MVTENEFLFSSEVECKKQIGSDQFLYWICSFTHRPFSFCSLPAHPTAHLHLPLGKWGQWLQKGQVKKWKFLWSSLQITWGNLKKVAAGWMRCLAVCRRRQAPWKVIKEAVYLNSPILQILVGYRFRREDLRIKLPLVLYSCIIPRDFLVLIFYFWKYPRLKVLFPRS